MKLKKVLSLTLAAMLMLSGLALTACSGSSKSNPFPIVCGETGMNDVAGVATYGVSYYNLGVKAGDMAADILLNGATPAATPVSLDPNPALVVNNTVASEIGFTIPDSVKSNATDGSADIAVTRVDSAIAADGGDYTVGVLQLMQHVALDLTNKGFVDQLSVRMDAAGKTVTILDENAAGDQANNITIAETFVNKNVDLIYAIATSSAQAAASSTTTIPVIFNAVTDPVGAGLVASLEAPGANVTGVSDINPVAKQIDLIGELLGKEDITVGLLYTSAETNSIYQIEQAKAECDAKGYKYVEKGIGDMNDIEAAFVSLRNAGVDAVYIPTDNVLANGIANVHAVNIGK
ncbi:MAG: ABC transporter substrate-binding protein [Clostridia bacterium]|nr:ABC transporter substrate-binding protein [Clostridia bacterium]